MASRAGSLCGPRGGGTTRSRAAPSSRRRSSGCRCPGADSFASEIERSRASVAWSDGVAFVPAVSGLGAPPGDAGAVGRRPFGRAADGARVRGPRAGPASEPWTPGFFRRPPKPTRSCESMACFVPRNRGRRAAKCAPLLGRSGESGALRENRLGCPLSNERCVRLGPCGPPAEER